MTKNRKLDTGFLQRLHGEKNMGVTAARPELHLASGLLRNPLAQVLVGPEKAIALGVLPFLTGGMVKSALGAALLKAADR